MFLSQLRQIVTYLKNFSLAHSQAKFAISDEVVTKTWLTFLIHNHGCAAMDNSSHSYYYT